MLTVPPKGARLGLEGPMGDTMLNVKTVEDICSGDGHENYHTQIGKWYEQRREEPLLSHVKERLKELKQQE